MVKYKLTIQYLGTRFSGWQIQKDRKTVQQTLKEAVTRVTGETASVVGAGRTDAGVHALEQVAHLRLESSMPARRLQRALNGVLPADIRVKRLARVSLVFHAQKDAVKKRYVYRIVNDQVLSPFLKGLVCHIFPKLDVEAMDAAARLFEGRHDFTAFAASTTTVKDRHRTVFRSQVRKRGTEIRYEVEADGFLHHMVRNMAGTLIEVGTGKRQVADIGRILESGDRRQAGVTAPPEGLYLAKVWYGKPKTRLSAGSTL